MKAYINPVRLLLLATGGGHKRTVGIAVCLRVVSVWYHRYNTRKQMRLLAPEQLVDVGLTERQRDAEMDKFFWQP